MNGDLSEREYNVIIDELMTGDYSSLNDKRFKSIPKIDLTKTRHLIKSSTDTSCGFNDLGESELEKALVKRHLIQT